MLVFKLLFVSVCAIWTSEGATVPLQLQQFLKKNEDTLPQASFPVVQQFYHTDEQIADADALDLFKSLNPTIQIGTADLLVSTSNQQKSNDAPKSDVKPVVEVTKPNEELTRFYEEFVKDVQRNRYFPIHEENPPGSENSEKSVSESKLQPKVVDKEPELKEERPSKKPKPRKQNKTTEIHNEEEISYHENPGEIPTKPIYPGEGQWALRNLKHRPHITKHYDPKINLKRLENQSKTQHQPEGKEVFNDNRQIFNEERDIHQRNLHDGSKEPTPEPDNNQPPAFVPYKNYAQVRKSETDERIPRKKKNKKKRKGGKRLKESIKDSKVHTIYTEEGYEDSAYDHGEQEKNAKRKEIEKNLQEETRKKHTDDVLPIPKQENYEEIAPQPPAEPEYHEEQTKEEENDGEESRTSEKEGGDENEHGDENEENPRGHEEINKENIQENDKEDNKRKRDDSAQRTEEFSVKIDEGKYPKDDKKVEENKEAKVEVTPVKEEVITTEKPTTTTKRNIFGEDWFQKYKFDNIGDYYTDAFSTKNKKEDKQTFEESQQAPREVANDKIQEKPTTKEDNQKSAKIEDQDWFQKYRLDNWQEYLKQESQDKSKRNSAKAKDNVKHRDQDKEYDVSKQEEHKEKVEPENSEKQEQETEDNMSQTDKEIKLFVHYPKQEQAQEESEDKLIDSMAGETKFGLKIKKSTRIKRETNQKFPYYKSEDLDAASSLRYAENFNNIPAKKKGVMAFYDKADKTECPETTEVNPVPEKIGQTNETNKTKTNSTEEPRLEGRLGDQIDCMKSKYFGDNPLDNPLFSEEDVEVPTSIFKDEVEYEYYDDTDERQAKSTEPEVRNATEIKNSTIEASEDLPKAEKYIRRRKVVKKRRRYPYPPRVYRRKYYRPTNQPPYDPEGILMTPQSYQSQQSQYPSQPSQYQSQQSQYSSQPSQYPSPQNQYPSQQSMYPSQPTEYHPQSSQPKWSRPMVAINEPSKQFSEVHYKEEIKPSEQLNVFTDIINNIKHSNEDSSSDESSVEEIAIIRKPSRHKHRFTSTTTKKPFLPTPVQENIQEQQEKIRYTKRIPSVILPEHKDADEIIIVKRPPMQGNFKPYFPKEVDNIVPIVEHKRPSYEERPNYEEQPSNHVYKHQPAHKYKPVQEIEEKAPVDNLEITTNNYFFLGMRPPPEFPYTHPNFYDVPSVEKTKRRRNSRPKRRRRVKRSNNRRGYAEISRGGRNGPEDKVEIEEDDDYVPHRPKTFHYDEKTGMIVYDKKPEEEPVEYEEIEYVEEVEEATHPPKKKKKKEEKRFPPTPPPGPSYLDFIKILKDNPNYTVIEDPKPKTDEEKEESTTTIRTVVTPTGVPEFLQILGKVKTDKTYEVILDPTPEPKKKKTTTTLEPEEPEEPDIEQSEEIQTEVQNSPGLQGILGSKSSLQVFDISEFVPKPRDFSPRTSIDTSKYTVIRRNHPKIEDEEPKAEKVVLEEEVASTTLASRTIEIPTSSLRSTTPYKEETTTAPSRRVVLRGRRRSTTPIPTGKSTQGTTARPERRQRGRSRYRSTTEAPDQAETIRNRRNLHPRNHRRDYAETRNDISNVLRVKPTPRSITLNIINHARNRTRYTTPKQREELTTEAVVIKNDDVEVFKDYDKGKTHGGNYKYKKVVINTRISSNYEPINEENGDKVGEEHEKGGVKKTDDYFKDTKLPEQVNGLKEKKYEITETIFEEENDGDSQDFFEEPTTTEETSTKKIPNIIKDPSKRLYFYAPI